ncbi:CAAX prenyl protease 2 [Sitodiplosis mosellana]|uniref:CAAX prenyl protease 2 n=1 Tax=Sitodiplosis mosellana TaxID=263140 RepID=UPI0024447D09|nr:CAAX prenyl protease 2 [Sitodiplosis mosellana]
MRNISSLNVKMESDTVVPKLSVYYSTISCLFLSLIYVGSMYVWRSEHNRDHPSTVKKRFFSVFMVMLISPVFIYVLLLANRSTSITIWEIMGFRTKGILVALFVPLLLTATLFFGPICAIIINGVWKLYLEPVYWVDSFKNILWIRNHIVAPLSEEFTFRACMMPLLLQSYRPTTAVLLMPLFFGVAHLHHNIERVRSGMEWKTALIVSTFQFVYTGIFGIYSAYLFAKTGHFIAPFVAHAFCNHMGFPDIQEVLLQQDNKKYIILSCYVIGLIGWIYLLPVVTKPEWYSNELYWKHM